MKFEEVLEVLGGFGRYQWYAFFFLNLVNFMGAFTTLQHVFYSGESDHWCKTFEPLENCTAFGYGTKEECEVGVKTVAIPPAASGDYYFENCRQWNLPAGLGFSPNINYTNYNATAVPCKNGWVFNHSQYRTSIIEDWELVCDNSGVTNIMTSVFFAGFMVGSFVFGSISDWFGRKKALYIAMVLWFLGVLATPFTSAPWNYYIVRFVTGMGQLGRWIPTYVLVNEFVAAEWRIVAGVLVGCTYSIGYMTVGLVAMAIRSWRVLAFVPIIPVFLSLFVMLLLTESARWLLTKGRVREAEAVIRKVGRWNRKELPDVIFDEKEVHQFTEAAKGRVPSFYHLYMTPNMCLRTLILQFNWMTNSMVYYGLAFSTDSIGFDTYWTFVLFGAVEIPALIYATVGIRVFGRKINMVVLEVIGGIACLSTIFIEDLIARTFVGMIGKFCITATFNIVYLWTGELYPTPVRTVTLGVCSVTARVGSIVAPLIFNIAKQDNVTDDLHLIVFGATAVIAGILLIPLPETKGRDLPDTMREGEEFGKFQFMKKWRWGRGYYNDTESMNVELNMDVYGRDVINPAFVPDEDGYSYKARPPPYQSVNEKACQFPEKPKKKRNKKDRVGVKGPKPGAEVLVGSAAVQESGKLREGKGITEEVLPKGGASQSDEGTGGVTGGGNDQSGLARGSGDSPSTSSKDSHGDSDVDKASNHGNSDVKERESGEIGGDVDREDGDKLSSAGGEEVGHGGEKVVEDGNTGRDGDKGSDGGDTGGESGDKTDFSGEAEKSRGDEGDSDATGEVGKDDGSSTSSQSGEKGHDGDSDKGSGSDDNSSHSGSDTSANGREYEMGDISSDHKNK